MPRVTAQDVADRAGCSTAAVSLVVNGRHAGRVSPRLRADILRAVDELGYRTHPGARALATGSSRRVALVCPDLRNAFFADMYHGALAGVGERFDVEIVVERDGHDYDSHTVRFAQNGEVAGLILASPSRTVVAELGQATLPLVLVDASDPGSIFPSIDLDLAAAGEVLAEHLCGLGHRVIGYLDSTQDKTSYQRRRDSFVAAAKDRGAIVVVGEVTAEQDFASACEAFLANQATWAAAGVTAVVCAEERLTFGALQGARAAGLAVPAQMSIAGFDDTAYAALVEPALTSVRFDAFELGQRAGATLAERIDGVESGQPTLVPISLHVRESTGAAPVS
ncbi:LacI family transcriptional regulator [Micromonospora sp. CPCC 205371]|nr:LacI family transcriptional regulator [Micromonospora sp. CPCC 205371]